MYEMLAHIEAACAHICDESKNTNTYSFSLLSSILLLFFFSLLFLLLFIEILLLLILLELNQAPCIKCIGIQYCNNSYPIVCRHLLCEVVFCRNHGQ